MGVSWTYKSSKWSKRFCNSLDSNPISFDGITDGGHTKTTDPGCYEALNLEERWDCLASRIARHGGLTIPSSGSTYQPTLSPIVLAWNKNPQCPQRTWTYPALSMPGTTEEAPTEGKYDGSGTGYHYIDAPSRKCVPRLCSWDSRNKKDSLQGWIIKTDDRRLVVPRHTYYDYTLWASNYVENYFPKSYQDGKHIIAYGGAHTGFWLLDANEADFAYAIIKSSMFRAWCELTEHDGGAGHFTVGMWDTFPLPYLSPCNEKFIIGAAKDKNWDQLNVLIDKLFVPGISNPLQDSLRLQILAEGFLDAFYGA